MERAQSKLGSELKEQKEIEIDLRNKRDSIELQLKDKSLELEKLIAETGGGNKEFKAKISEKDDDISSLRKNYESEKSAKEQLEKSLNEIQNSISKHKKDQEVLETATKLWEQNWMSFERYMKNFHPQHSTRRYSTGIGKPGNCQRAITE